MQAYFSLQVLFSSIATQDGQMQRNKLTFYLEEQACRWEAARPPQKRLAVGAAAAQAAGAAAAQAARASRLRRPPSRSPPPRAGSWRPSRAASRAGAPSRAARPRAGALSRAGAPSRVGARPRAGGRRGFLPSVRMEEIRMESDGL
jgi:hypothetical protein